MNAEEVVKNQIADLTDYAAEKLSSETQLDEIGLVSLDFVSIQVSVRKELNKKMDLSVLSEKGIDTVGKLVRFIEETPET